MAAVAAAQAIHGPAADVSAIGLRLASTAGPPLAHGAVARYRSLVMNRLTSIPLQLADWRLIRLIWPFVAIVVLLLALGTASLQVIRGVRAYIGAESVWSNAQKAAVEALELYAQTRNEDYFDRYG